MVQGNVLKKYFQTVEDQKGDYISWEAIVHGGEKLIIGSFKCFENRLTALKKNSIQANKTGFQEIKYSNYEWYENIPRRKITIK